MTPQTWADVVNWMMLGVGGALFLGTGAALWRHRRTGEFPGQPADPSAQPSIAAAWTKTGIGLLLALWGLGGLVLGAPAG